VGVKTDDLDSHFCFSQNEGKLRRAQFWRDPSNLGSPTITKAESDTDQQILDLWLAKYPEDVRGRLYYVISSSLRRETFIVR
jgi:hypothetical protein